MVDTTKIDSQKIKDLTNQLYEKESLPGLMEFVRIPNLSPQFDPEWNTNGLQEKCANFLKSWVEKQGIKGCKVEIIKDKDFTPLIFVDIERTDKTDGKILFYGHFDKQPHFTGWKEGLHPTDPKIIGDRLYGRGSSDDGYCLFSCIQAIRQCQELGYPHPHCQITIEGCEESGSTHYMDYLDSLKDRIGKPSLLICLDSGAGDYNSLWLTNSLRGAIMADLTVEIVKEGLHSGDASGIVPSSFRIIRKLIDRIENIDNGEIIPNFQVDIPPNRYSELFNVSQSLGNQIWERFCFVDGAGPTTKNAFQAYVNRTWKSQLSVTGADGMPTASTAGNVLRPFTQLRLSMRTPPTLDSAEKAKEFKQILESNPPYGAKVTCEVRMAMKGYNAPTLSPYLQKSLEDASVNFFGKPLQGCGEGGSIPLIVQLQEKFPGMQIIVSGLLGPESNAHGPNEMLHLPTWKNLTASFTQVIADFSSNYKQ